MAIDLAAREPEGLLGIVALVTVLAVWIAFVLILRWLRWRGLDGTEKRRVARLRQQIATWSPRTVTIPRSDDLEDWRRRLIARSQGDGGEQTTVADAISEVRAAFATRLDPIPRLSLYLATEAAALALAAGAVIVSAPAIRRVLQRADVGPGVAIGEVFEAVTTAVSILWGAFPGTNVVWALVTVVVLQGYTWLSSHAFEVAAALLAGAIVVGALDRVARVQGDRRLYPDRRRLFARLGGWLVAIYLVGAGPATAGTRLGYEQLGTFIGGGAAFLLSVFVVGRATVTTARRLRSTAALEDVGVGLVPDRLRDRNQEQITFWYLLVRRVALLAGVIAAPVALYYVGLAIAGGHVPRVLAALLAAPLPLQLGVVLLALVGIVVVVGSARDAWIELGRALQRATEQQGVRVAVFVSIGPVIVGLVTVTLLLAFGIGILWAGFAGALLAVVVRLGYRAWQFVTYKIHTRERREGRQSVTVAGPTRIELPDQDLWVARVNATELAWPHVDRLVDDVIDTVEGRFEADERGPTASEAYYEWLEDTGQVDVDEFRRGQSAEARSRLVELIRDTSGRVSEVDHRLRREYGQAIADEARRTERNLGRVSLHDGVYHLHERRIDR